MDGKAFQWVKSVAAKVTEPEFTFWETHITPIHVLLFLHLGCGICTAIDQHIHKIFYSRNDAHMKSFALKLDSLGLSSTAHIGKYIIDTCKFPSYMHTMAQVNTHTVQTFLVDEIKAKKITQLLRT